MNYLFYISCLQKNMPLPDGGAYSCLKENYPDKNRKQARPAGND